jgi:glutaredoxin-dependent peroxiredoxin
MTVSVGQQAPEATLVGIDRKAVKISDLRGKTTVLAFFPAAFTSTCTKEMCRFRDELSNFDSMRGQVVGISADTPFTLAEFAKQNGLKQLLLSDFNHEAMKAYGVHDDNFIGLLHGIARRSVFVIDKSGKVVYTWVADQPGVEPPYDQVQAAVQKVNA